MDLLTTTRLSTFDENDKGEAASDEIRRRFSVLRVFLGRSDGGFLMGFIADFLQVFVNRHHLGSPEVPDCRARFLQRYSKGMIYSFYILALRFLEMGIILIVVFLGC